ncbi:MAG: hypothetical protein JSS53_05885 [Proteobacteria bacterium]|nr:hypothetical protein [Pseudomonadota bacterium]
MNEESAVRYIQLFWRKRRAKEEKIYDDYRRVQKSGGFYHLILKLKKITPPALLESEGDTLVNELTNYCVTTENKHGLRMIAYVLFADKKSELTFDCETRPIVFLLYCVFSDLNTSARDIAFVLRDLFTSSKRILGKSIKENQKKLPENRYWGDWVNASGKKEKEESDMVHISHGGGLFYIIDFLTGRKPGYALEAYGLGLQVAPSDDENGFYYQRANEYAIQSFLQRGFFDLPATLKATISCKSLMPAKNCYEAGLRPEYTSKLNGVSIEELVLKSDSFAATWPGVMRFNPDFIKNRYGTKYPIQQVRLSASLARLFKLKRLEIQEEEYDGHRISDNPRFQIKI